jgi:hypothetical protein
MHKETSPKSESPVNTQNQEPESIVTANADPLISANQKLLNYSLSYKEMSEIEKSNLHLQQQNQALAIKRTQESDLVQNKNLTNKEKIKIEKENRRNTLLKTIPPTKRAVYTGHDFSPSFPQNY